MTMTNAEWLVKNKYDFGSIYLVDKHDGSFKIMYQNGRNCIGEAVSLTSTRALTRWLSSEHKDPILDEEEKRYLSAVIRPFRESVRSIEKSDIYRDEAICINTEKRYMVFPPFKAGTMYKGMELNRKYTLEELGL